MRSATRHRPAAVAALVAVALSACSTELRDVLPTPEAGASSCLDLGANQGIDVTRIAWSQTGAFMAVGAENRVLDTDKTIRVLRADGTPFGEPIEGDLSMLTGTVVVTPDGRLAWVEDHEEVRFLVEDVPDGRQITRLPDRTETIAWTAGGYVLLQRDHSEEAAARLLVYDPDHPGEPTVLHEERGSAISQFWISADLEQLLLTVLEPGQADPVAWFEVVGATTSRRIDVPAADVTGASMPSLRSTIVYRSTEAQRMVATLVDDPAASVVLSDRQARGGMVSDRGILAYMADPPGTLCVLDVSAQLRALELPF